MIDWLYSFRQETKQIIERTNQLKKENERLRKEIEALRSVTPEKLLEIVKKSTKEDT
jgi:cell division protein FtsL